MAVQKSRKSRSRRGMRRAHNALGTNAVSDDKVTGETHRRHHMTESGYYKGRQIVELGDNMDSDEE